MYMRKYLVQGHKQPNVYRYVDGPGRPVKMIKFNLILKAAQPVSAEMFWRWLLETIAMWA